MSRYRKVETRIWDDEKFRGLTDDGKLLFLNLLTHPGMTMVGAMRGTLPGLAEERRWSVPRVRRAFVELMTLGMVEHDPKALLICLPKFLRYNAPESPNVVKAWRKAFDSLPESGFKASILRRARMATQSEALGDAYREVFAKSFPEAFREDYREPSRNQEQEQEPKDPIQGGDTISEGTSDPTAPLAVIVGGRS